MFVADGYTKLTDIRRQFDEDRLDFQTLIDLFCRVKTRQYLIENNLTEAYLRNELEYPTPAQAGIDVEDVDKMFADPEFRKHADIQCFYAFLRFTKQSKIFLAGPDSQVIPVDHTLLERASYHRGEDFRRWRFLDNHSLTVNVEGFLKKIEALQTIMAWDDLPRLSVNDRRNLAVLIDLEPTARILLPYQGFTVCVPDSSRPDVPAIRCALSLDDVDYRKDEKKTGRGRPRKMEEAREAFERQFPEGRKDYTWKVVLEILRVEEGLVVSEDTLRNALNTEFESRNS